MWLIGDESLSFPIIFHDVDDGGKIISLGGFHFLFLEDRVCHRPRIALEGTWSLSSLYYMRLR